MAGALAMMSFALERPSRIKLVPEGKPLETVDKKSLTIASASSCLRPWESAPPHWKTKVSLNTLEYAPVESNKKLSTNERKVFIFDWDDTLFSTSWLQSWVQPNISNVKIKTVPPEVVKAVKSLEEAIFHVLEKALTLGDVFVITNSDLGWVETTASLWVPKVVPLLERVRIISARSAFEKLFPGSPLDWKIESCRLALRMIDNKAQQPIGVISIGDAIADHESTAEACRLYRKPHSTPVTHKWIKFLQVPLLAQVRSSLEILTDALDGITCYGGDLSLFMSVPGKSALSGIKNFNGKPIVKQSA